MPCSYDRDQNCGGAWRNLVYDIRQLDAAQKVDCGLLQPIDCTNKAGYDPSNQCLQRCVSDVEVTEEVGCLLTCKSEAAHITFKDEDTANSYLVRCQNKCGNGVNTLTKYIGCYNDRESRDLNVFINSGMRIKECFDEAKRRDFMFVGL